MKTGNHWSTIFVFTYVTLIFVVTVHLIMLIGIVSHRSRLVGLICSSFVSCVHLASIITTGVFRFSTKGKLAALSNLNTNPYDDTSHTYNDVAALIVWLWVLQMLLCVSHCCKIGYHAKPPAPQ